jgi:arylsulfatase
VHDESEAVPWMTSEAGRALVRWPWKVVVLRDGPGTRGGNLQWLLFNLADDPGEITDLSEWYPELKSELVAQWSDYGRGLNALGSSE